MTSFFRLLFTSHIDHNSYVFLFIFFKIIIGFDLQRHRFNVRIIQAQAQIKLDTNTGKNLTLMALYSLLYSVNVELQLVHSSWKTSRTILLHKDGDLKEPSNWRSIALIDTTARLFTSCLATRLLFIIQKHSILSPEQNGFLPAEGCFEHNFMLQSHIEHNIVTSYYLSFSKLLFVLIFRGIGSTSETRADLKLKTLLFYRENTFQL